MKFGSVINLPSGVGEMGHNQIIFDLGMNNGDDTEYYLAKGYKVVAVEANPKLCMLAAVRFSNAVLDGRLVIVNAAIADSAGDLIFYINTENDHWSSLDKSWASRNDSNVIACSVKGIKIHHIIEQYGEPFFIKIDIEGGDMVVLHQIMCLKFTPHFLSVEDCRSGFEYLDLLWKIGYRRFKLSNQAIVPAMTDLQINYRFRLGASGMFGDDLPGEWLTYESFLSLYEQKVRNRKTLMRLAAPEVWWDIHCAK